MSEVQSVAPGTDIDGVLANAVTNMTDILDGTAEDGSFTSEERSKIDEYTAEARTDDWFNRYSTTRLFERYDDDERAAEVAFKSEKLIKASFVVGSDDVVRDVQFTGDMYHRPAYDALAFIDECVRGQEVHDVDAIRGDIKEIFDRSDIEFPWLSPDDFVRTIERGSRNLVPLSKFER